MFLSRWHIGTAIMLIVRGNENFIEGLFWDEIVSK